MIQFSKKGTSVNVVYSSANFDPGQTVTADVMDSTHSAVLGSPFTMVEIGSTGIYTTSFTPSLNGTYIVLVSEAGEKRATSTIEIMDYSIDEIGTLVQGITPSGSSSGGYSP